MDFFERLMSTYHTWQFHFGFRNEMFARAETVLDKHFPGEKRRSLDTLEKNASLALSFGHPHLTDGFKPSMPNYIQIGVISSQTTLTSSLKKPDFQAWCCATRMRGISKKMTKLDDSWPKVQLCLCHSELWLDQTICQRRRCHCFWPFLRNCSLFRFFGNGKMTVKFLEEDSLPYISATFKTT